MADKKHAILSASASHRWLNCTPSARLELEFEDNESEAAAEGTAAHALCEHKLKKALKMRSKKPTSQYDSDEMDEHADGYTGIVTSVSGDYFTTIEGNTSGGSSIIANGGGVCKKGYYNSNLPGTKFCRPEYNLIEEENNMANYTELKAEIEQLKRDVSELKNKMIYNYIDENMPAWARPTIQKMVNKKLLQGNENGELGLTDEMLRIFVINDRAGLYDHRWDGKSE